MDDFWRHKALAEMTALEWESLCDGCGRCCLHKICDWDTGELSFTRVACHQLVIETGKCRNYTGRQRKVPDCVQLTVSAIAETTWLPNTCAYRLLFEGHELPWWHPLVSGSDKTVHEAMQSVHSRGAISEKIRGNTRTKMGFLFLHIVDWQD